MRVNARLLKASSDDVTSSRLAHVSQVLAYTLRVVEWLNIWVPSPLAALHQSLDREKVEKERHEREMLDAIEREQALASEVERAAKSLDLVREAREREAEVERELSRVREALRVERNRVKATAAAAAGREPFFCFFFFFSMQ